MFAFNDALEGCHGNTYRVDLLWRQGGLVVEIDSYQTHGNRHSFGADRHRDYEMLATGCRVLRITNDEALSDTASAVEKIRRIVRVIKGDDDVT
ncbi:MAG: DUF559 domain-containing protein [Bryobacteraceae bacterium]|nr:DUF559 domain-containing protein [Bryobacteraceae bacterium]